MTELTNEIRAQVLTELIEDTREIEDRSRRATKTWLLAKRAILHVDPAHSDECLAFFKECNPGLFKADGTLDVEKFYEAVVVRVAESYLDGAS